MSGQSKIGTEGSHRAGMTLAALAIAQLTIGLDYNIVFVALPEISADLGFPDSRLQWAVSAYTITFGGFLLLGGRCADLVGRRPVLYLGLAVFAGGSLLGTIATGQGILLAARAVQGLGAAFLAPAVLSLVTTTFAEGSQRNRALGVWGAAGSAGMVLGSLAGGMLTDLIGWRAVFAVNLPIVLVVGILAARSIPADRDKQFRLAQFDLPGAIVATVGATALVLALVQGSESGWTSPPVTVAFVITLIFLAGLIVIERRARNPLLPGYVLAHRNLIVGAGIAFSFMATLGAIPYFLTLVLQNVVGLTSMQTGLAFIVPCVGVLVGTAVGARLATAIGLPRTLIGAALTGSLGLLAFGASLHPDAGLLAFVPGVVIFSLAQGVLFTAMFSAATSGVQDSDQGLASGIASSAQQLGGAVGLAVLVAAASVVAAGADTIIGGARVASFVAAVGLLLAAGLAATLNR